MIKEKRFAEEQLQRQLEEERARIPKANPYPYSTDIAVVGAILSKFTICPKLW